MVFDNTSRRSIVVAEGNPHAVFGADDFHAVAQTGCALQVGGIVHQLGLGVFIVPRIYAEFLAGGGEVAGINLAFEAAHVAQRQCSAGDYRAFGECADFLTRTCVQYKDFGVVVYCVEVSVAVVEVADFAGPIGGCPGGGAQIPDFFEIQFGGRCRVGCRTLVFDGAGEGDIACGDAAALDDKRGVICSGSLGGVQSYGETAAGASVPSALGCDCKAVAVDVIYQPGGEIGGAHGDCGRGVGIALSAGQRQRRGGDVERGGGCRLGDGAGDIDLYARGSAAGDGYISVVIAGALGGVHSDDEIAAGASVPSTCGGDRKR